MLQKTFWILFLIEKYFFETFFENVFEIFYLDSFFINFFWVKKKN